MNFIYILSTPRSGSTLVQKLINQSDEVFTLPETWYLLKLFLFDATESGLLEFGFDVTKKANKLFEETIDEEKLAKIKVEHYREIISELSNKNFFIEKTPRNILIAEKLIKSRTKNDKFIIIRRKRIDILNSYLEYFDSFPFFKGYKFLREINFYNTKLNEAEAFFKKGESLILNFEDLVDNTKEEILKLSDFLGLSKLENKLDGSFMKNGVHGDQKMADKRSISKGKRKMLPYIYSRIFFYNIPTPTYIISFILYKINIKGIYFSITNIFKNKFLH